MRLANGVVFVDKKTGAKIPSFQVIGLFLGLVILGALSFVCRRCYESRRYLLNGFYSADSINAVTNTTLSS
jgi:hypothetical protein